MLILFSHVIVFVYPSQSWEIFMYEKDHFRFFKRNSKMYVYVKSLTADHNLGSQWVDTDIRNLKLKSIFSLFRKIYVTLTNIYLTNPVVIDLDTIKTEYCNSELTFNEFLDHIGNRNLVTTLDYPELKRKFAVFSDAFRAGYKVEPQNIYAAIDAQMPASEKTSLRLSRPNPVTNMQTFYDHCLVTINGFFHRTDCDGNYAYVLNANKSMFKSRQNQIGILNFLNIGKVKQIPITQDMISKQSNNLNMRFKTFLTIEEDITDKTVMLVLGGYLLFIDGKSFLQINEKTFALIFNDMPILERLYESRPYLNLESLGLPVSSDNESLVNADEFLSDEVLTKYMMMDQSFFVVVDTPSLTTTKHFIRSSNLPGMFTSGFDPVYPLFVGNGRVAEYWKTHEDGFWSVTVQDSYLRNNVFSYNPQDYLNNISDHRVPDRTTYNSRGFLLEIESNFI